MGLLGVNIVKLVKKGDIRGLAKALDDDDWSICTQASTALAVLGDRGGTDALLAALAGPRERSRKAALWNAHLLDERAVEPLVALLSAVDEPFEEIGPEWEWTVAISAAASLCELGDRRGLDSLIATTKDPDLPSRAAAISALATASDSGAREFLTAVLAGEEDVALRPAEVIFYIGRMREKASWAVSPLVEVVRTGQVVDAQMAMIALANIAHESAIPALTSVLSHPDETRRRIAGEPDDWSKLLARTGLSEEELRSRYGVRRKLVAKAGSTEVLFALESEGLAAEESWA